MLVLSRKLSERVLLTAPDGQQISVVVVEIVGGRVRLGIDAPAAWSIRREEIATSGEGVGKP